jgi:hypothetical protein
VIAGGGKRRPVVERRQCVHRVVLARRGREVGDVPHRARGRIDGIDERPDERRDEHVPARPGRDRADGRRVVEPVQAALRVDAPQVRVAVVDHGRQDDHAAVGQWRDATEREVGERGGRSVARVRVAPAGEREHACARIGDGGRRGAGRRGERAPADANMHMATKT